MKKIKLALLMAGIIGTNSFQLQAQEFPVENYNSLSTIQQEENFVEVIIKLEEGYTLQDILNESGFVFKKVKDMSAGYILVAFYKYLNITEELNSLQGVLSADLNVKMIIKNRLNSNYNYQNIEQLNLDFYNDTNYLQQKHFEDSQQFKYGSSIERLIKDKKEQNKKMRIGIIDTGTTNTNDLIYSESINMVEKGRELGAEDFSVENDPDTNIDYNCSSFHGLDMAYTISAIQNNNTGGAGIVNADIVMVRGAKTDCYDNENSIERSVDVTDTVLLTESINWLAGLSINNVENISFPVDIINISLGGQYLCSPPLQTAIDNAVNSGIVLITSAGNEIATTATQTPANCNNVIVVSSHSENLRKSTFAPLGDEIDFTALGENMLILRPENINGEIVYEYNISESGTSFSAAITSGVVGLLKEKYPEINQSQASILLKEGVDINEKCPNLDGCGAGILNAYSSMVIADQVFGFVSEQKHFYQDKNSCKDTVYLEKMDNLVNVCELYNIEISHPESFISVDYEIIRRDSFQTNWTEANTEVVSTVTAEKGVRSVSYLLKDYSEDSDYGIRACISGGDCINIKDVDFSAATKPAYCE
jgi:hypothetical protein